MFEMITLKTNALKYKKPDGSMSDIGVVAGGQIVDNVLSVTSENPVQNKVITEEIEQLRSKKASALITLDSGNPLEFWADADSTVEFVLDFGPIQLGSGVATPDNIRSLTKRSAINVVLNDNTYTISCGREVCGGTIDSSGIVTDKEIIRVLTGSEGWYKASSAENTFYFDYYSSGGNAGNPSLLKLICSHYKTSNSVALASSDTAFYPLSYTGAILRHAFTDSRFATLAEWKEYLAQQYAVGTPVQVSEPVTNPVAYTCPAVAFHAVDGKNIAYCEDAYTLSARYSKSLTKVIEELKNAIISLGGNV